MKRKILSVLCVAFIVLCFVSCKPDATGKDMLEQTGWLKVLISDFNLGGMIADAADDDSANLDVEISKDSDSDVYYATISLNHYGVNKNSMIRSGEIYLTMLAPGNSVQSMTVSSDSMIVDLEDDAGKTYTLKNLSVSTMGDTTEDVVNVTGLTIEIVKNADGDSEYQFKIGEGYTVTIQDLFFRTSLASAKYSMYN